MSELNHTTAVTSTRVIYKYINVHGFGRIHRSQWNRTRLYIQHITTCPTNRVTHYYFVDKDNGSLLEGYAGVN